MTNPTPTMTAEVVPCGGIVKLSYVYEPNVNLGPWSLTRAASGSTDAPYQIYEGNPIVLTIDSGQGTNIPLNPATTYTYTLTTPDGVATTNVQPASTVSISNDDITTLLFRVMQAAFAGMTPPNANWQSPRIIQAMPLTGQPALPIISISDNLLQQEETPIGENIGNDTLQNDYYVRDLVARRYRITVMTYSVDERTYYRDAVIGIFKSVMGPLLESIGQNIRHRYQAASSQVTGNQNNPGFYFCDLSLEFTGNFFVTVTTNYGAIAVIYPTVEPSSAI